MYTVAVCIYLKKYVLIVLFYTNETVCIAIVGYEMLHCICFTINSRRVIFLVYLTTLKINQEILFSCNSTKSVRY